MNSSVSWLGLLVTAAVIALLVQCFRMSPAGWMGLVLKVVMGLLILLILAVVAWNTVAVLNRPD